MNEVMHLSNMLRDPHRRLRRIICLLFLVLAFTFIADKSSDARVIRDQANRIVSVPDNPEHIVSLAPSITEIIFALGEADRLKGVTQHCDFPAAAQTLPKVGSYVHLDLEKIVALKPDLCIAVRDGNPRSAVDRLETLGIPVYAVDPRNLDTVADTILEIGQLSECNPQSAVSGKRNAFQDRTGKSPCCRSAKRARRFLPNRDRPNRFRRIKHPYPRTHYGGRWDKIWQTAQRLTPGSARNRF